MSRARRAVRTGNARRGVRTATVIAMRHRCVHRTLRGAHPIRLSSAQGRPREHAEAFRGRASGSGDVLAGLIGGLCARGAEPLQAAVWAVHVHALAGDVLAHRLGPLGYLASELLPEIPSLLLAGARGSRRSPGRP